MIELNKVLLVGRLTKDPELRYISTGSGVCELRLAADRSSFDKNTNERKSESLFINVTAWGKQAEFCQNYLKKGSGIFVEGRLRHEQWKDKEGRNAERISITAESIRFAETKAEAQSRSGGGPPPADYDGGMDAPYSAPPRAGGTASQGPPMQDSSEGGGTTDDLPF